jgi:NADPH2:quinone reductase
VRLHASGVNPSDVKARAGGRPGIAKPPFPKIIPHSDGAGVIEAVGQGISADRIGERVWIWNGQWQRPFGTAAEYIALPAEQAVSLPDETSFAEGAVLGIPGLTACHCVLGDGDVAGKNILVSGGAGTVGRLAVQIAAASGARVFSTARGAHGVESARTAGAERVFDYTSSDLPEQILEATGGVAMDRIIEVEFGSNVETNTKIISDRGTIVAYGSAADRTPTIPFYPLLFKGVSIELVLVYILSPIERNVAVARLRNLLEHQELDVRIDSMVPLKDCASAHELVELGGRSGAVVLTI